MSWSPFEVLRATPSNVEGSNGKLAIGNLQLVSPPSAAEAKAAEAIVARWNERIPRNRVRRLTVHRLREIRFALREYSLEEILAAIEFYGAQKWNRRRNAWLTFDHFLASSNLTYWFEQMVEARERAARKGPVHRRAARLTTGVGRMPVQNDGDAELRRRLAAMPPAAKEQLLARAATELGKLVGDPRKLSPRGIEKQALAILARKRHSTQSTCLPRRQAGLPRRQAGVARMNDKRN